MNNIGTAGVRAVKWSVVSTISRFALQLLAQVILARLLGPHGPQAALRAIATVSRATAAAGFSLGDVIVVPPMEEPFRAAA